MFTLVVICGPSGIGKSYLKSRILKQDNFENIIQTTTRLERSGEKNAVDYFFVEKSYFEDNKNLFVGISEFDSCYYGFNEHYLYNKLLKNDGICVCSLWNIIGLNDKNINVLPIFLYPSQPSLVRKRLTNRGETKEKIELRVKAMDDELKLFEKHRHLLNRFDVIDDNIENIIDFINSNI